MAGAGAGRGVPPTGGRSARGGGRKRRRPESAAKRPPPRCRRAVRVARASTVGLFAAAGPVRRRFVPRSRIIRARSRSGMRAFRAVAALAVVLALALAAPAAAQGPIKIGEINSYSGVGAAFTAPYRAALEMALEEINAKGGVLGRKIERSEEHTSELHS